MKCAPILLALLAAAVPPEPSASEGARVQLTPERGQVRILVDGRPFARYVYEDPEIRRPYFCDVREPGGLQVTRNHPPGAGDALDHATMHPGLWLGFGDFGGSDFWRNKGRVEQVEWSVADAGPGAASFLTRRRYLTAEGAAVARETCRYTVAVRPHGILLISDSEFTPAAGELVFGDQEEMGFGVRVATAIAVRQGGRILNSAGAQNEKGVWGKTAEWCDYSAVVDGRRAGLCVMPDPANFRPSWFHARDYGLLVANPFGRKAFTGGEPSRVVVKQGDKLRLRFGVLVYGAPRQPDLRAAYQDYLARIRGKAAPHRTRSSTADRDMHRLPNLRWEGAPGAVVLGQERRQGRVRGGGAEVPALRHALAAHPVAGIAPPEPTLKVPLALDPVAVPVLPVALLPYALLIPQPPLEAVRHAIPHVMHFGEFNGAVALILSPEVDARPALQGVSADHAAIAAPLVGGAVRHAVLERLRGEQRAVAPRVLHPVPNPGAERPLRNQPLLLVELPSANVLFVQPVVDHAGVAVHASWLGVRRDGGSVGGLSVHSRAF